MTVPAGATEAAPGQVAASQRGWNAAKWLLLAIWLTAAAANVARLRGWLTSYAADLFQPPWLYIVMRQGGLVRPLNVRLARVTASPTSTAVALFVAGAATEVSQLWPGTPFGGTFDPLDLVAFAAGLGACLLADLRWPIVPPSRPARWER